MFKNIIFDWSGVIKDAAEGHFMIVKKMFEKAGLKDVSMQEVKDNWEEPYMLTYNRYIPGVKIEEQKKLYAEIINGGDIPESKAFEGMVELVKKLRKECPFVIVLSADSSDRILFESEKFGLENTFTEVISDAHNKTENLLELIRRNDFKLDETVFVGDGNHEIEVSKKAGIKSLAVTWGLHSEAKLKALNPDYLVHNVKELEEILLK